MNRVEFVDAEEFRMNALFSGPALSRASPFRPLLLHVLTAGLSISTTARPAPRYATVSSAALKETPETDIAVVPTTELGAYLNSSDARHVIAVFSDADLELAMSFEAHANIHIAIQHWALQTQSLLSIHEALGDDIELIDAAIVFDTPDTLLSSARDVLGLPPIQLRRPLEAPASPSPYARALARQLVEQSPHLQNLQFNLNRLKEKAAPSTRSSSSAKTEIVAAERELARSLADIRARIEAEVSLRYAGRRQSIEAERARLQKQSADAAPSRAPTNRSSKVIDLAEVRSLTTDLEPRTPPRRRSEIDASGDLSWLDASLYLPSAKIPDGNAKRANGQVKDSVATASRRWAESAPAQPADRDAAFEQEPASAPAPEARSLKLSTLLDQLDHTEQLLDDLYVKHISSSETTQNADAAPKEDPAILKKEKDVASLKLSLETIRSRPSWKAAKIARGLEALFDRIFQTDLQRRKALLRGSDYFDPIWYKSQYPDAADAEDPAAHYLRHWRYEMRDPGPDFSTRCYIEDHEDVARSKLPPVLHYLLHGACEGRYVRPARPSPKADQHA